MEVIPHNNAALIADGQVVAGATTLPLYQNDIQFESDTTNTTSVLADCATLVRNASMSSQNRGMVESIRRVDTLRSILWNLENR